MSKVEEKFDENELSLQAISLMLNNEWETVDKMLVKHKYVYLNRYVASLCFTFFIFTGNSLRRLATVIRYLNS